MSGEMTTSATKAVKFNAILDPSNYPFTFHLLIRSKPPHFHHIHWRGALCRFLHNKYLHLFSAVLLILDMMLLISSMHIEVYHLESEIDDFEIACEAHAHSLHGYGDDNLLEVEEHLKWASVSILCFFGLDIVLSLLGEGVHYLYNPMHCVDIVVVGLSLFFELQNEVSILLSTSFPSQFPLL